HRSAVDASFDPFDDGADSGRRTRRDFLETGVADSAKGLKDHDGKDLQQRNGEGDPAAGRAGRTVQRKSSAVGKRRGGAGGAKRCATVSGDLRLLREGGEQPGGEIPDVFRVGADGD